MSETDGKIGHFLLFPFADRQATQQQQQKTDGVRVSIWNDYCKCSPTFFVSFYFCLVTDRKRSEGAQKWWK